MKRGVSLILAACFALLVSSVALAKNDDGVGGGGGGGGYSQRDSGLYVPRQYVEPKRAPAIPPSVGTFGKEFARDAAKQFGITAIGAAFANVSKSIGARVHTITLTGWPARCCR